MGRPKSSMSLEINKATSDRLDRLQEWMGATSRVVVIRKAIEVLNIIEENRTRGGKLLMVSADGTTTELILL